MLLDRRADMVEAALTLPVMILITLGLITFGLASYASNAAQNAALYGARMGSVAQTDPAGTALQAALERARAAGIGDYTVTVQADPYPGGRVVVRVRWGVPNHFAGILQAFGLRGRDRIEGEAVAYFRKEGW